METDITLKEQGFEGFYTIKELSNNGSLIPAIRGVYVLIRATDTEKVFLEMGVGGYFKGRDPNVSIDVLDKNWVNDAKIVYIGKAGGEGSAATLRSRLKCYLDFGKRKAVGHWGGRLIWQLSDAADIILAWKKNAKRRSSIYLIKKAKLHIFRIYIITGSTFICSESMNALSQFIWCYN
jgi:hypothetical protein